MSTPLHIIIIFLLCDQFALLTPLVILVRCWSVSFMVIWIICPFWLWIWLMMWIFGVLLLNWCRGFLHIRELICLNVIFYNTISLLYRSIFFLSYLMWFFHNTCLMISLDDMHDPVQHKYFQNRPLPMWMKYVSTHFSKILVFVWLVNIHGCLNVVQVSCLR